MPPRKRKCTPKLSDDRDAKQSKLVLSSEAQNLIDEVEEQGLACTFFAALRFRLIAFSIHFHQYEEH